MLLSFYAESPGSGRLPGCFQLLKVQLGSQFDGAWCALGNA